MDWPLLSLLNRLLLVVELLVVELLLVLLMSSVVQSSVVCSNRYKRYPALNECMGNNMELCKFPHHNNNPFDQRENQKE